jgi:hypothetical protein
MRGDNEKNCLECFDERAREMKFRFAFSSRIAAK